MNAECYMLSGPAQGGGNARSETNLIVRRHAAIGDALCATVVADRLSEKGYGVTFQAHPDIHCVLQRVASLRAVTNGNGFCHVDLDGAYERDPQRRLKHFHTMFFEQAARQLLPRGIDLGMPLNCRPSLTARERDNAASRVALASRHPKPWVMICPRSDSYNVRQVPDGIWKEVAERIPAGTKFWLGRHPAPDGIVDLKCDSVQIVMNWLAVADLLISVDTGPLHIGAALGIPIVAIGQSSTPEQHLSDQRDFVTVTAKLECLNCQENLCRINRELPPCQGIEPELVASWANAKLRSLEKDTVSAIIPVYRPEVGLLNKCLEAVVGQVDEVIVCRDQAGEFPRGTLQHPKIRYVVSPLRDIGLARKWNYAARQSTGRWLLFLNDDCIISGSCLSLLLEAAQSKPGVGIVAPLLRYPDGTIYHAGKVRQPGERGWGHLDYRKYHPTLTEVTELENICGCCMLVLRQAWYEAGCGDEEVYLYTEDDRLCLSVRKAGYKVLFAPRATGVHEEGSSTKKTPGIVEIMHRSNASFGQKWGSYFEHNANRIPGNFDYLMP